MADENRFVKYWRYALGEIFLVVIGILIALQVNNWNENRIEQNRIKKYAKSMVKDLEQDIDMLNISMIQAEDAYSRIDSLRNYALQTEIENLSNTLIYTIAHDVIYRTYSWNRSTFDELKSSGSLRLVQNDSLKSKLVAYIAFSQHLDEDFTFDKINAEKVDASLVEIINLNSPFLSKIKNWEVENFNTTFKEKVKTQVFKESVAQDLPLVSYDREKILQLINTCIIVQESYRVRAFMEMPEIIEDARELIELLKQEYD
ncbi:DUF6090 family protein [Namhaeicola litoreus]|uniref:DUF6090 family protein n=1 Tax=Namhaeicola litoreus TaxID=1052145 RepID=A0ABW3XZQ1_9FLAO